jgi:hypothetical protein
MKHQPQSGHLAGAEPVVKPTYFAVGFMFYEVTAKALSEIVKQKTKVMGTAKRRTDAEAI